jgi:hypothetical protein
MVGMVGNGENRPVPVIPGLAVKVSDAAIPDLPVLQAVLTLSAITVIQKMLAGGSSIPVIGHSGTDSSHSHNPKWPFDRFGCKRSFLKESVNVIAMNETHVEVSLLQ